MNFIHHKLSVIQFACSLLLLCSIISCKKEQVPASDNNILSISTKDAAGNPIKGALTADNNIVFYWPPLQAVPDSITPIIKIAAGSTITPASGTKVAFNEKTTFEVKGRNGISRSYQFKILPYDPDPYIISVGFSPNNLYKDSTSEFYDYNQIQLENVIFNDGLAETNKKIQLTLIDANNKEIPLKIISKDDISGKQLDSYLSWIKSFKNTFFVSVNAIDLGTYKQLKLKYNNHTVTYDKNINVKQRK